jgi:hypothetical protein
MNRLFLPRILTALGIVLVLSGLHIPDARAQEFGRIADLETNVAYFYHARPGEPTVQVSVWGTVPRPGIYEVPDTTELDKLLTMAGGVPLEPRTENQNRPEVTVRLFRPRAGGQRSLLFKAPMDSMLAGTAPRYPQLGDNDILVVETETDRSFTWRDGLTVGSSLISVALLIVRIIDIQN